MASKVTVDRSYFEALLRRADFHIPSQAGEGPIPASSIAVSRVEYDSLLRTAREHQLLKDALFQGGITEDTLNLLVSGSDAPEQRKDSACPPYQPQSQHHTVPAQFKDVSWRTNTYQKPVATLGASESHLSIPSIQRQVSYGMSTAPFDDAMFEDDFTNVGETMYQSMNPSTEERRTLYFNGLSDRTTYRDLVSVIKGGKLLCVTMRSERAATVSFLDGAPEFLAWTKRNDIYLQSKRVEVKWADRQFTVNGHTANKITNGATRNVVVRGAREKGLDEQQIRDDMEHISNLVIIDVTFRGDDAYVSMNSIHNALFARTCMMSRQAYRGCKIQFYPDECDVPLPQRSFTRAKESVQSVNQSQKPALTNRFSILDLGARDRGSDEENRTPSEGNTEVDGVRVGVSLDFLDGSM